MFRRNSGGLLPHTSLPRDPHGVVLRGTKRLERASDARSPLPRTRRQTELDVKQEEDGVAWDRLLRKRVREARRPMEIHHALPFLRWNRQ
jgi:hypothetical protein